MVLLIQRVCSSAVVSDVLQLTWSCEAQASTAWMLRGESASLPVYTNSSTSPSASAASPGSTMSCDQPGVSTVVT